eukprot:TRINITY_DN9584_c0_g2_i1.p3 TRINITY_DN9584_c0_g2~~TRINITY_DN9584_c0_g2_i1.p3  ORF type:complete len:140 (+),score=0.62 TRINITY_DN9584_c0_g2_i1:93-512(+)
MAAIKEYKGAKIPIKYLFCQQCGSKLIRHPQRRSLVCLIDGNEQEITSEMTNASNWTRLNVEAIRDRWNLMSFEKHNYQANKADIHDGAIDMCIADHEICEKCGTQGLHWFSRQMRSADEGSTVFFMCPKCRHVRVLQT